MYFSNIIGFLSQLGTFMIIFSILYLLFKFIINVTINLNKDYIILNKIYLSDFLSIILSIIFIIKFIHIYPVK